MMEIKDLTRDASRGKKDAQFKLGMMHLEGKAVDQDFLIAEKWLKKAAKKKHPDALYQMGMLKLETSEYVLALSYFKRALKQKMYKAYKMLGHLYKGDYDPSFYDETVSAKMFFGYYKFDKFDGLEPLLAIYRPDLFKSKNDTHRFLKEAMDFGLLKAQYHLGMLYLNDSKFKDYEKAVKYLEDYFVATADINAAKELYYLYSPKEERYPQFKQKNSERAKEYLKHTIESDGVLEGTEFLQARPVYMNHAFISVDRYLDQNLSRMKTSLAIDQDFSETVSLETFDARLEFKVDVVFDYDAKIDYKEKQIEEEIIEKEIEKKQTVRKGFKKTGTVKIPQLVKKTKKRKFFEEKSDMLKLNDNIKKQILSYTRIYSLKDLVHKISAQNTVMMFGNAPSEKEVHAQVEKTIHQQFSMSKKPKKIKTEFSFDFVYLIKPLLHVTYLFGKERYAVTVSLEDKQHLDPIPFPLDPHFSKTLKRFENRQASMKRNQIFLSVMSAFLIPIALIQLYHHSLSAMTVMQMLMRFYLYHVLSGALGLLVGYLFIRWMKVKTITAETFIKHYDDTDLESLSPIHKKNTAMILLKFVFVLILIGVNFYFYAF